MFKPIKTLICSIICSSLIIASGCTPSDDSSNSQTTAAVTSQLQTTAVLTSAATDDTAAKTNEYNYIRIKEKSDEIMSEFDSYMNTHKYMGVVYYKIGNDFEYIGSNGMAVVEEHTSNSINTAYYAGSITKQFTAAAVLLLAEQKKLSLDDTIDKYYPSYKYGKDISIYNLLTMTSGIKSYMSSDGSIDNNIFSDDLLEFSISADNSSKENKSSIMSWIFKQDLIFEPDTQFRFSDSNYYILGDIIEQVSEKSYEEYITEYILKPLGMNSTSFEASKQLASGYQGTNNISWIYYPGAAYSSSGMITSVSDMLKWISALDEYLILSEDSVNLMFTPYKENYGCGMFVNNSGAYQMSRFGQYGGMLSYARDESEIYVSFTNFKYSDAVNLYAMFQRSLNPFLK